MIIDLLNAAISLSTEAQIQHNFFSYQNMGTAYHVAVKFLCKCLWVCYTHLVRECQVSTTAMTFWIEDTHVSRLSRALIWITRAASTYLQLFWLWPSAVHSVKTWGILPLWGNICPRNEQYTNSLWNWRRRHSRHLACTEYSQLWVLV